MFVYFCLEWIKGTEDKIVGAGLKMKSCIYLHSPCFDTPTIHIIIGCTKKLFNIMLSIPSNIPYISVCNENLFCVVIAGYVVESSVIFWQIISSDEYVECLYWFCSQLFNKYCNQRTAYYRKRFWSCDFIT